jgi:membrane-bound lytic murein transglycosylase A
MHFVMLVPKRLDPVARGRKMPLPDPRPSEEIAKLFPQSDASKDQPRQANADAPLAPSSALMPATSQPAATIPLPEPRPRTAPGSGPRHPYLGRYFWRYYRQ